MDNVNSGMSSHLEGGADPTATATAPSSPARARVEEIKMTYIPRVIEAIGKIAGEEAGKVNLKYRELIEKEVVRFHKMTVESKGEPGSLDPVTGVVNILLEKISNDNDFSSGLKSLCKDSVIRASDVVKAPKRKKPTSFAEVENEMEAFVFSQSLLDKENKQDNQLLKGLLDATLLLMDIDLDTVVDQAELANLLDTFLSDHTVEATLTGRSIEYVRALVLSAYLERTARECQIVEIRTVLELLDEALQRQGYVSDVETEYETESEDYDSEVDSSEESSVDESIEDALTFGPLNEVDTVADIDELSRQIVEQRIPQHQFNQLEALFNEISDAVEEAEEEDPGDYIELTLSQIEAFFSDDRVKELIGGLSLNDCKAFIYMQTCAGTGVDEEGMGYIQLLFNQVTNSL